MTGVKRYEEELQSGLESAADPSVWKIDRVRPPDNTVLGSTFPSWLFTYRSDEADIVHLTDETLLPATYFHSSDTTIVTCHGLIPLRYPSTITDLTTRVQWRLIPRAIERADQIIAISEFTKSEILDLTDVSPEDIEVVYHGIDHNRYTPLNQAECREQLDLEFDPNKKYVLVVASKLEQKRMDLVQAAFDEMLADRDDVTLLKAGYGKSLTASWVQNTGWIDEADMPKLYNAADVFFHPSEYESFGFPVLEAMACGTPVVASDRASIPEVAGDAAALLDPDAEDAGAQYADAIQDALDTRIDEQAVEQSKDFSWQRTTQQVLDVYERSQ